LTVDANDFRLRHKTNDRAFYTEARNLAGTFEVALCDAQGFVTEGSFTNIFVKGEGALLTPPLSRGLLPGVLRAELLANGSAVEADLRPEELANGFFHRKCKPWAVARHTQDAIGALHRTQRRLPCAPLLPR
jgi:para-aminobenzoate synthetase/4-amino-4-deoxychorismate lyase